MALVKAAANTVGIAAHLPSGQIMKSVEGTVAVMDGKAGPQAVLVIEKPTADKPLELMVPFVAAFVDNVDLVARRISVDWQLDY